MSSGPRLIDFAHTGSRTDQQKEGVNATTAIYPASSSAIRCTVEVPTPNSFAILRMPGRFFRRKALRIASSIVSSSIELAFGGVTAQAIELWAFVPALRSADAVVAIDLDDLAAHSGRYLPQ